MIHITSLDDGLELFKALGSDIRIQILKILLENNQMSMNQIANELNISNGALTGHIKKLGCRDRMNRLSVDLSPPQTIHPVTATRSCVH